VDRLILVRHGETPYNAQGLMNPDSQLEAPLSAAGEWAVRRLARSLGPEAIDVVVTSPRHRALRTAELLAAGRGIPVRHLDELAEIGAGSFEGGPVAAFQEWVRAGPADAVPPGGETVLAAAGRYLDGARSLQALEEENVVAVTHNLPMRMLVNAAGGGDPLAGPLQRVPHATRADLSAAELTSAIAALEAWVGAATLAARPADAGRCGRG
jgi:broad specificity phosphatase PhoE